jgi:hypothetical protein
MTQAPQPYWAPQGRPRYTRLETLGIIVRHLIPLAGMLWLGWSAGQFLLLGVFDIAFSVACIGVLGVAVSTRKTVGNSTGLADRLAGWLALICVGAGICLLLTALFGWVIVLLATDEKRPLFDVALVWSAFAMVAAAAPALLRQYQADLHSSLSEEQRKRRDQPQVLGLVMCAGLIFILSGQVAAFGKTGIALLVGGVVGLSLLRDLRPDLVRELTRPANRPP